MTSASSTSGEPSLASIDQYSTACHIGAGLGTEEHHNSADITARVTDAAERNGGEEASRLLSVLPGPALKSWTVSERYDGMDSDAVRTPLERCHPTEEPDRLLGHPIDCVSCWIRPEARSGGKVDYNAAVLEVGVTCLHQAKGCHWTGLECPAERLFGYVQQPTVAMVSHGIVDQDVESAKETDHLGDAGAYLSGIRYITAERSSPTARLLHLRHRVLKERDGSSADGDGCPCFSQGESQSSPQAPPSTGDQRNLAGQLLAHDSLLNGPLRGIPIGRNRRRAPGARG